MRWPRFYRKRFLLGHAWTRALYLHQEVATAFWDGHVRLAPRRSARLFDVWRNWDELRAESNLAFESFRGGDVLDVGAAEGWYGCLLAPLRPPKILAMEPDLPFYTKCLQNFSYLQSVFPETSFVALPKACGSGKPLHFTYQYGHLALAGPGTPAEVGSLPTMTIDRLVEFFGLKPGFLKVDVEGFEEEVLAGARETVSHHRPVLLLELHKFSPDPVGTRTRLDAWLQALGYHGHSFFESESLCRMLWKPGDRS